MLDEILEYHKTPEDSEFVAAVMKRVRRQQQLRRLILAATGLTGAVFGAMGVLMLSDSVGRLITEANVLPVSVALVGVAVFMAWLFRDEVVAVA
jgi:ABC-type Fe3+-siderophore transport system permease subunit